MKKSTRRLLWFGGGLLLATFGAALVYMVGMAELDHNPRSFMHSLMTVVETLTTTGFGADSSWEHPFMNIFMILLQILGLIFVFLFFPLYLIPVMEERFQARLPIVEKDFHDHVIFLRYRPAVSLVMKDLSEAGVDSVVLDDDPREARRLLDMGIRVVYAGMNESGLAAAGMARARTLVALDKDDQNAAMALTARQSGFEGEILALAEHGSHRKAMLLSGCNEVFTPSYLQASALASRASDKVRPTLQGAHQIGKHLEVCEIRVDSESGLAGRTLRDLDIARQTGAQILGQWIGGRLEAPALGDTRIEARGVLVVAGSREAVARLGQLAGSRRSATQEGRVVVAGYGEVGRRVVKFLRDAGEEIFVIDRKEGEGVDLAGDLLDLEIQDAARLENARSLILALDADSSTLFATVMLRDRWPTLPIIARVNEAENVDRIHRAGADFAIAVSQVAGRMLAAKLLGRESIALDEQLTLYRMAPGSLAGRRLADLDIRGRTGFSIVAVERGELLLTEFPADFQFEADDGLFVCGRSDELQVLYRFTGNL
jgi:Trk K+ transport system NAD-binding subunit